MLFVENVLEELAAIAPPYLAEKWDNVGLLVGSGKSEVTGIIVALDAHSSVIDEAVETGCNVVVVHHPVIFQPIKHIRTDRGEGRLLQKALANDIAIIACHTNFDNAADGVSRYLAEHLALTECQPLLPLKSCESGENLCGTGCIGKYSPAISGEEFLERLFAVLAFPENAGGVQIAGTLPNTVHSAALCGGSGGDFAEIAREMGAEIYVSAEIKHHIALWAAENNFCVIDASHYATEKPAVSLLVRHLSAVFAGEGEKRVPVFESRTETHPFRVCTPKNVPKK